MYNKIFKRLLDIIFSILLIPITLIIIIISACFIKIEDSGSIFYIDKRIGKNGKLFKMFKLRTMVENALDIRLEDGSTYNSENDPRVTKFGKFARKTSIDELPQVFNVLIGNMSFIGPRPDPADWLDKYPDEIRDFLKIKPGITGYNQAYFRNETDGREKMINDYFYYKNISFLLDCKIFFKTIITILKKDNIYKRDDSIKLDKVYEIGSEFDYYSNAELLDNSINNIDKNTYYFQSGRDGFKAIAEKYAKDNKKVLLPALCCESMVNPFEKYNYDIEFYPLNSDYSINFSKLNKVVSNNSIFIFINYFGNKAISDGKLNIIRKQDPDIIIIEDKTHDFLVNYDTKYRDYIIISIRKWISIPDGGLVITNNKLNQAPCNKKLTKIRVHGMKSKSKYFGTNDPSEKENFMKLFKEANKELDKDNKPHKMSAKSKRIYSHIDLKKLMSLRKKNIEYLINNLKGIKNIELMPINKQNITLYLPILVENRDKVQKKLAKKGIYCPIIWPLPKNAKNVCEVSNNIANKMLAIPCDQRYKKEEMDYIVKTLKSI